MPNTQRITGGHGLCTVPGCQNPRRSSVSPYCTAHHSRARIHGAANQTLVTRKELKPFEDRVRKVMATANEALVISSLTEINKRLLAYAEGELAQYHRGVACDRRVITGCDQIAKVCRNVDPVQTAVTLAAMFFLQDSDPRKFPKDEGFTGQLVRQYRLPSGVARGWTYDDKAKKDRGWYRPLPKEVTAFIGRTVTTAYTPWLVHLKHADQRMKEEEKKVSNDLARAFAPKTL